MNIARAIRSGGGVGFAGAVVLLIGVGVLAGRSSVATERCRPADSAPVTIIKTVEVPAMTEEERIADAARRQARKAEADYWRSQQHRAATSGYCQHGRC